MKTLKKVLTLFGVLAVQLVLAPGCNPDENDLVDPATLDQWTYFTKANGLPSDDIITLYQDSEGRMWIGTGGGLSIYDGITFTNYTVEDGLLSNMIYAIMEDNDGKIWVGTPMGLNALVEGKWLHHTLFNGVGVNALLQFNSNEILVGTGGAGVYQVHTTQYDVAAFDVSDDCDPCNSINALYTDSKNNIWVGSFGGARRIKGQTTVTFDKAGGLSGDIVSDFCEDSFGNIWVGCVEGTTNSRISGNHVEQINFSNGVQNFTWTIEMDKYDNVWIGTFQYGLYKYDGAFMDRVYEGVPGNTIRTLLKDRDGALWIGTTAGLARYIVGVN